MKTSKRKNTIGSMLANLAGKTLLAAAAFALVAGTPQAEGVVTGRDWINIGDLENGGDTDVDGYGGVAYGYEISSIATTVEDWDAFYGDGSDTSSGIGDGTAVGSFNSAYNTWENTVGAAAPVVNVNLNQAAQYANWLTTGDATEGAYTIDGSGHVTASISHDVDDPDMQTVINQSSDGTVYVIPTEDEWYKAAYYRLEGTGSGSYYADATPPGVTLSAGNSDDTDWAYSDAITSPRDVDQYGLEQNGTRNMMGNVWEWQQVHGGVVRGGSFKSGLSTDLLSSRRHDGVEQTGNYDNVGFRVVAIPEPASAGLLVLVGGLVWFVRRRVRA